MITNRSHTLTSCLFYLALVALLLLLGALYFVPPIRYHDIFFLQTFDYGILFESSQLLAHGEAPYIVTRGLHTFADNQDYFQIVLALLHHLPWPRETLLVVHSLGIFCAGLFTAATFEGSRWAKLFLVGGALLSPFLLNMSNDLIHTEAFATLFLLLLYWSARSGYRWRFYLALILALSCKEDVAITVGVFSTLALLERRKFQIGARDLGYGLALALVVFFANYFLASPYFKALSCDWLMSSGKTVAVNVGSGSPWFANIAEDASSAKFWRERFLTDDVLRYAILLFWPFILILHRLNWMMLLPVPGFLINLIGGDYLIQGLYHYDHSSFAGVMIALAFSLSATPRSVAPTALFFLVALFTHWKESEIRDSLPLFKRLDLYRINAFKMTEKEFWLWDVAPQLRVLEHLRLSAPAGVVISADYTSLSYLLLDRHNVFMFENPLETSYFGIKSSCDGTTGPLDKVPAADLVLLRDGYNIRESIKPVLDRDYRQYQLSDPYGRLMYMLFIRTRSPYAAQLLEVIAGISRSDSLRFDSPVVTDDLALEASH